MAAETFTWGDSGERLSATDRKRRIAEALMLRGSDTSPVQHWTQGLARVADAIVGKVELNRLDAAEKAGTAALSGDRALLMGGASSPAAVPVVAASADAAPVSPPVTPAALAPVFTSKEAEYKLPSNFLPQVANIESRFDPNAKNPKSTAEGLFQFTRGTARDYGLTNPRDPIASTDAAARLAADNAKTLTRALGRAPTAGELYLAHQQGGGGASQLLSNPNARAVDIVGRKAVVNNGGHEGMSAGDFAKLWTRKVASNEADMPASGAVPVGMETGQPGFVIPGGEGLPIMQPGGALPNFDQATGRWLGPSSPAPAQAAPAAPLPAPAMTGPTFDAIASSAAPASLDPAFQDQGVSQPWMGSAIMPAPPEPQIAQTAPAATAPLPPARPADLSLASPQADMPAAGAVPAMGQVLPQLPAIQPDLSNESGAGMRQLQVASEEARQGQTPGNANQPDASSPFARIAAALGGQSAPAVAATPVSPSVERVAAALPAATSATAAAPSVGAERVAAAMPGGDNRTQAAIRVLNSPYAKPGDRAVAQSIVDQSLKPQKIDTVDLGNSIGVLDARGNVVRQIPKTAAPSKPTYGKIGVDPNTGEDIMGFIDPERRSVEPTQPAPAGAPAQPSTIPPPPPGVNAKIWRESQSKRAAEDGMPASFDDTTKARTELAQRPSYKNITAAAPIYKSMLETAGRNSKASDLNIVYGLGKIMDPTSVVREGEMIMVKNSAGLSEQVLGAINALNGGAALTPETRAAIMQEAHGRMRAYEAEYNQDADFYRGIAKNRRMNPDEIAPKFEPSQPWKAPAIVVPGAAPAPASAGQPAPAAVAPVASPKSKADYDALPSGTPYTDPTGKQRVKP